MAAPAVREGGWPFWGAWVAATGLAFQLSNLLEWELLASLPLPVGLASVATAAGAGSATGVVTGVVVGGAQWLVLRGRLPRAWPWIGATALAFAIAGPLVFFSLSATSGLGETIGFDSALKLRLGASAAGAGAVVGFAQWLVLRRWVAGARVWILAAVLGGAAAALVDFGLPRFVAWFRPEEFLDAAVEASALVWLLRAPKGAAALDVTASGASAEGLGGGGRRGFWARLLRGVRVFLGALVLAILGLLVVFHVLVFNPETHNPWQTGIAFRVALYLGLLGLVAYLLQPWKPRRFVWGVGAGLAASGGLAALALGGVWLRQDAALQWGLGLIEDVMAEVAIAKSMGDEALFDRVRAWRSGTALVAYRSPASGRERMLGPAGPYPKVDARVKPTLEEVRDRAAAARKMLDSLPSSWTYSDLPGGGLAGYKRSVWDWAFRVQFYAGWIVEHNLSLEAARPHWDLVPPEPQPFAIELPERYGALALGMSLSNVRATQASGDRALATGDREAMRSVAARLQAQSHWLKGWARSQRGPVCQGGRGGGVRGGPGPTEPPRCLDSVARAVPPLHRSAWGYVARQPEATQDWRSASLAALPFIQPEGLGIGGAGITVGEPAKPTGGPPEAFVSQCAAKGGVVGGTGGVMAGLPTTEAGWSCWYPPGAGQALVCWDFLTYSGQRYMGGDHTCPTAGLAGGGQPGPPQAPAGGSWDGAYEAQTTGTCTAPGYSASDLSPGRFEVRGNQIVVPRIAALGLGGRNIPIDASGRARMSPSELGIAGVQGEVAYVFSRGAGGIAVGGTGTLAIDLGAAGQVRCSFSISGRRIGPLSQRVCEQIPLPQSHWAAHS